MNYTSELYSHSNNTNLSTYNANWLPSRKADTTSLKQQDIDQENHRLRLQIQHLEVNNLLSLTLSCFSYLYRRSMLITAALYGSVKSPLIPLIREIFNNNNTNMGLIEKMIIHSNNNNSKWGNRSGIERIRLFHLRRSMKTRSIHTRNRFSTCENTWKRSKISLLHRLRKRIGQCSTR